MHLRKETAKPYLSGFWETVVVSYVVAVGMLLGISVAYSLAFLLAFPIL